MRPTLAKACAQRSFPEFHDIIVAGCRKRLLQMRFVGEVSKPWKERRMVQCVGLAALSVFIHDHPSHCLPVWPTTGLGRDWPLGGVDYVAFAGRRLIFGYRRLFLTAALAAWAFIPQRNSHTASLRRTAYRLRRPLRGLTVKSMSRLHQISKHLRRVFGNTVKIIRSPRPAAPPALRLVCSSESRRRGVWSPSPPRLSARPKEPFF